MKGKYGAIPFTVFLIVLIASITWSDQFAEDLSEEPRRIFVGTSLGNTFDGELWQFEQETDTDRSFLVGEDSSFIAAVQAYENKAWNTSEMYFDLYSNTHGATPEILNYLGLIAMKTGRLTESKEQFERALLLSQDYQPAAVNLALLYSKLENYELADSLYRTLVTQSPFKARPRINHGIMLCRISDWANARTVLDGAVENSSGKQKAKALTYRGMTQINLGDTTRGKQDFEAAMNLAPDYILPRVYLALVASTDEDRLEEITKVTRLKETYAPAHYYRGIILDRMNLKEEARFSIERALELNPGDEDLSSLLGSFYINNNLIEEAENYFSLVYKNDSLTPQNYFYQAKIATRKEEMEKAIALYEKAIDASGKNYAEAYHNLGILLKKENRFKDAVTAYEKAIDLRSNYESAWYNLALTHRATGSNDKAIEAYKRALSINPYATKSMYNLAAVYSDEGQEALAVGLWERIIENDPNYAKAWYNLGLSFLKQERYEESIRTYDRMLKRFPSYAKAWYNKALALKELELLDEAIASYEKAIRYDATYLPAWKNLGALFAQQGKPARAIDVFNQAIEIAPADPELRYNIALQLKSTNELQEAAVQLNKAIQLRQEYLKAIDLLAEIAIELKDLRLEFQTREYRAQLNQDPMEWYDIARDLHKDGQFEKAIVRYSKAEELGKNDVWTVYWSAKAYEESGNASSAIQGYQEALKRKKNHKFSLYRLALLLESQDPAEASRLRKQLTNLYPEFAKEKGISP